MTTKGETSTAERRAHRLQEMGWNEIERPGCYVVVGSGDLIRVPPDALAAGHSPLLTVTSVGETRVAKLCDNPVKPISVLCTPVWQCHAASRPPDELRSNHVAPATESGCDGTHRAEKEIPHTK